MPRARALQVQQLPRGRHGESHVAVGEYVMWSRAMWGWRAGLAAWGSLRQQWALQQVILPLRASISLPVKWECWSGWSLLTLFPFDGL